MLVGILSDTHGRLSTAALAEMAECDAILHAGDICGSDIMVQLRSLAPTYAVVGNNDVFEYGRDVRLFLTANLEGVRFCMAHTPRDLRKLLADPLLGHPSGDALRAARNADGALRGASRVPTVGVHGHTHVPEVLRGADALPADLVVCPGAVTYPRGGMKASVMKLEVRNGEIGEPTLVELT